MKTICPRCEQSWLERAYIKSIGQVIFICEECEAMWEEGTILELSTFKDYGTYMEAKGYDSSWNHLD